MVIYYQNCRSIVLCLVLEERLVISYRIVNILCYKIFKIRSDLKPVRLITAVQVKNQLE